MKEDLQAMHSEVSFAQDEQLVGHGSLTGVAQESFNKICAELHSHLPAFKLKEDLQAMHSEVSLAQDEQLEGHGSLIGVTHKPFSKTC